MTDRIESVQNLAPAAPAPAAVPYLWLMTVQIQTPRGLAYLTRSGAYPLVPGRDTRTSAYIELLRIMREQTGIADGDSLAVLAFVLEPDALGGAA
ncbi:hypothetical protein [Streptomyces sp. NPDC058279]|uniref:hypothetical protein n=1 Tax=Streptomyces sp. NPDC058279 TaxID=3346418 RepID=UPI0036EBE757